MKPIAQTTTGTNGDCFRACIASLLERPIDDVPVFPPVNEQWGMYWRWLYEQGFDLCWYDLKSKPPPKDEHYILSVPSPTLAAHGLYHAVIALNGAVVWDPHPDRDTHVLPAGTWFETIRPLTKKERVT